MDDMNDTQPVTPVTTPATTPTLNLKALEGFTPGPWTAERETGVGYLIHPSGVMIPDHYQEHHADAALIAAAPELHALAVRLSGEVREAGEIIAGLIAENEALNAKVALLLKPINLKAFNMPATAASIKVTELDEIRYLRGFTEGEWEVLYGSKDVAEVLDDDKPFHSTVGLMVNGQRVVWKREDARLVSYAPEMHALVLRQADEITALRKVRDNLVKSLGELNALVKSDAPWLLDKAALANARAGGSGGDAHTGGPQ